MIYIIDLCIRMTCPRVPQVAKMDGEHKALQKRNADTSAKISTVRLATARVQKELDEAGGRVSRVARCMVFHPDACLSRR